MKQCFQSRVDTVCCNGHPVDRMHTKSPLPRSIISVLVSWSDAIWRLYLSPLTLLLCPVKFLTSLSSLSSVHSLPLLSPLPPFFVSISIPLSQLSHHFLESTHTLPSLPSCHRYFRARFVHERECCQWARHLSSFLPPSSSCSHVCVYFLFLFLTCLSSVLAALLGLRSITAATEPKTKKVNWYWLHWCVENMGYKDKEFRSGRNCWILLMCWAFSKLYPQCSLSGVSQHNIPRNHIHIRRFHT